MAPVLIAEDDLDVREILTMRLEKAGYTVRTADSGPVRWPRRRPATWIWRYWTCGCPG